MVKLLKASLLILWFCQPASVLGDTSPNPWTKTGQTNKADQRWELSLADGTKIVCRINEEGSERLKVTLLDGSKRTLRRVDVLLKKPFSESQAAKLKVVNDEVWQLNTNRTRHLYSPSAMPLKKGEAYVSQRMLFFTAGAYGVTDHVSILLGSVLPFLVSPDGFNIIGALKIAGQVSEQVHLAAGFESLFVPSLGAVGLGFGSMTIGNADRQVTIGAGKPFAIDNGRQETGDALISLAGMYRLNDRYGLVSENLIFPGIDMRDGWRDVLTIHGLVLRRMYDDSAWDLGFVTIGGAPVALPWFDWTWHFDP
ncbi:MAG: hypothetical protein VYA30_09885 [Myxococcota bacterium]|nr:hypothetical protein [Myxococcota bacterium]